MADYYELSIPELIQLLGIRFNSAWFPPRSAIPPRGGKCEKLTKNTGN
jgi:hypothetical protein